MGFMSGEKEGHLSRYIPSRSNQVVTILAVCLGSLSCWNHQALPIFNFFVDCRKFFCNISRYSPAVIFPSIKTRLPMPGNEKHPQHLTFPPSCFTVGTVHFGSRSSFVVRQTMIFPSEPNKLNLLSSDHIPLFKKSRGFSRYTRAYSRRLVRLTLLRYDFFRATRPCEPISLARR